MSKRLRKLFLVFLSAAVFCSTMSLPSGTRAAPAENPAIAFYLDNVNQTIRSILNDGSSDTLVRSQFSVGADTRALATDGSYLYYEDGSSQTIRRSAMDGTGDSAIVTGVNATGIFVNDVYLYFTTWTLGVFRANKDGSGLVQLVDVSTGTWFSSGVSGVHVTSSNIFFNFYGAGGGESSVVWKTDLNGQNPVLVRKSSDTTAINSNSIWIDGSTVYIADYAGQSGILSFDTSGNSPSIIRSGRSYRDFEVHGKWLYFTNGSWPSSELARLDLTDNSVAIESISSLLVDTYAIAVLPLQSGRVPVFDTPVPTADGFTVNVTNWDSAWSWVQTSTNGIVSAGAPSGSILSLTVTGLISGMSATVSVSSRRVGYFNGAASKTGSALSASTTTSTTPTTSTTSTTSTVPSNAISPTTSISTSTTLVSGRKDDKKLPVTGSELAVSEWAKWLLLAGISAVLLRRRLIER